MANPQVENGHVNIANEIIDKAFCFKRLSGREWQIIWVIIRKTWGWKKKMDAIPKSQFSKLTGIPRQKCQEILHGLVLKKVIIKGVTQKGNTRYATYGINKDFDKWQVLPKKVTLINNKTISTSYNQSEKITQGVTQKGNRVLPKKVTEVLPKKVTSKEKKETRQKKERCVVLPKTVTPDLWKEFKEHRKKKKSAMTNYAEYLMGQKLLKLEKEGYDPIELINKTIEKGWQDIVPEWIYKDNDQLSLEEHNERVIREARRRHAEAESKVRKENQHRFD